MFVLCHISSCTSLIWRRRTRERTARWTTNNGCFKESGSGCPGFPICLIYELHISTHWCFVQKVDEDPAGRCGESEEQDDGHLVYRDPLQQEEALYYIIYIIMISLSSRPTSIGRSMSFICHWINLISSSTGKSVSSSSRSQPTRRSATAGRRSTATGRTTTAWTRWRRSWRSWMSTTSSSRSLFYGILQQPFRSNNKYSKTLDPESLSGIFSLQKYSLTLRLFSHSGNIFSL